MTQAAEAGLAVSTVVGDSVTRIDAIADRLDDASEPTDLAGAVTDAGRGPIRSVELVDVSGANDLPTPVQQAIGAAIDNGVVVASRLLDGGPDALAIVRAVYDDGNGGLTTDPGSGVGGARRRNHIATLVGWLPGASLLAAVDDPASVTIVHGSVALGAPPSPSSASVIVSMHGTVFRVEVPIEGAGGSAVPLIATALLGLAVLATGVVADAVRRRRLHDGEGLRRQLKFDEEVGGIAQRSLELADVMPQVLVRISDEFDLDGVSCSTWMDSGQMVEAFRLGASIDPEASTTIAVPMRRGGRVLGRVSARPARALTDEEHAMLLRGVDMLCSAVLNSRIHRQQRAALERHEELNELKTVFLGTASHELRTPTAAIGGLASALVAGWDDLGDDEKQMLSKRIEANARALDTVVSDLLDFSRLEQGHLRIDLEDVNLSALTTDVVHRLSSLLSAERIATDIEPDVMVRVDRASTDRILTNLLSNANQYSPLDAPIMVRVSRRDDAAVLIVDDGGPGVPPAERQRIFSQFYRGSSPEIVKTRGIGIGLSLVAELVAQMEAEISVGDSPLGGARFEVVFAREDSHPSGAINEELAHHDP
ncbi:MAG TPA: HAMP domain-containing sensor histidine kinase [Acidimicrobiales bacterium]